IYQWKHNGDAIAGATGSSLALTNVQIADAGVYSVVISNAVGVIISSGAVLTVNLCANVPPGLVAWWRAEGNADDWAGGNSGSVVGGAGFEPGRVGQGFSFKGSAEFIQVPSSPSLRLTNELTLELWYKDTGPGDRWWYGLIAKRPATFPLAIPFGI